VPLKLGAWEAVLLTHGHADAMLGLDDLRHWTGHGCLQDTVNIWADRETQAVVATTFPYLVDQNRATGGGFVSSLQFHTMEAEKVLSFRGMDVLPLEVEHGVHSDGRAYMCLAFLIDNGRVAYFSDVSRIPEPVMNQLTANPPDLFILDCLREHRPYRSHFVLADCLEAVRKIRPRRTFLVGLAHDVEHEDLASRLKDIIPEHQVEPAFDGLVLTLKS
jgi:phosphoribosyl 1,2-cyclic phosphodiesterase